MIVASPEVRGKSAQLSNTFRIYSHRVDTVDLDYCVKSVILN
jgi:hypothetical protein